MRENLTVIFAANRYLGWQLVMQSQEESDIV